MGHIYIIMWATNTTTNTTAYIYTLVCKQRPRLLDFYGNNRW